MRMRDVLFPRKRVQRKSIKTKMLINAPETRPNTKLQTNISRMPALISG